MHEIISGWQSRRFNSDNNSIKRKYYENNFQAIFTEMGCSQINGNMTQQNVTMYYNVTYCTAAYLIVEVLSCFSEIHHDFSVQRDSSSH